MVEERDVPGVGGDNVGALDRLLRAVGVDDLALPALSLDSRVCPLKHLRVQVVPLRRRDLQVYTEAGVGNHHLVEDVVRVADPGDGQAFEGGEVVGEGSADFEEGLQVGKDLGGVVEVGEGVDDGNGGVLGEGLREQQVSERARE